ncbi:hypothetical protein CIHG_08330 [Coccidioides immitis H538.4]|uniref:Uncharacterized protein n=1 Tax=Coccidioides immitis H538.4 TaxID=396776 RepID=A0A0J8S2N2_COCIT|nr:hypothetical protein CIHG_08330 [Coccidioides immitis H538.4]
MQIKQLAQYYSVHSYLVLMLKKETVGDTQESSENRNNIDGGFDMIIYCWLRHALFSFDLENLFTSTIVKQWEEFTVLIKQKSNGSGFFMIKQDNSQIIGMVQNMFGDLEDKLAVQLDEPPEDVETQKDNKK